MLTKRNTKKKSFTTDWTTTPEYREAILLKVLRSMKSYGYSEWMSSELKSIGLSI